jgi:lactoylglutathione lyase
LRGSVLKVNASREPLAHSWSPYRSFKVADPAATSSRSVRSPDDVPVTIVPLGENGVTGIEIVYAVADGEAQRRFLGDVLDADEFEPGRFRLGTTVLSVEESPLAPPAQTSPMRVRGFTYMTIQVHDCNAEHERAVKAGATDAMSPRVLGTTARISFIRDPAGGWIELSQRANLVGHLD